MKNKMVIGIAGGSGSGKTTLSKYLADQLNEANIKVKVIHMDKYYKTVRPVTTSPFTFKEYEDFNHPEAVDIERVQEDFHNALSDLEYRVVIIEGFLLFVFSELREKLGYKVFVDCQSDERLVRRINKFSPERYSTAQVIAEYLDLVRFRHDEFVEPTRWYADLIINGSSGSQKGGEILWEWLRSKISSANQANQ